MKIFFSIISLLIACLPSLAQQGTSMRATNGIGFGISTFNGPVAATNLNTTNQFSGKFRQGSGTTSSGTGASAFGLGSRASGTYSHAEGLYTVAGNSGAHSEGTSNVVSGASGHAEGVLTEASGTAAHAQGIQTVANGIASHAGGYQVELQSGTDYSFGGGLNIIALGTVSNSFLWNADWGNTMSPPTGSVFMVDAPNGIFFDGNVYVSGGSLVGDGSGLTNLPPSAGVGAISYTVSGGGQAIVNGVYTNGTSTSWLHGGGPTATSLEYHPGESPTWIFYNQATPLYSAEALTGPWTIEVGGLAPAPTVLVGGGNFGVFYGDGANLTNIGANSIKSTWASNVFSGGTLAVGSIVSSGTITGNGAGLTNVTASAIGTLTNPIVQGGIFGPQTLRLVNSNILQSLNTTNVSIGGLQIGNVEFSVLTNSAPFSALDGCMGLYFSNRVWRLGGWSATPYTTNAVWSSSDGATWTYINQASWEARHSAGHVVFDNKMWIIGGDTVSGHYQNDVWSSADGTNWVLAATNTMGWANRTLQYVQVFNNKIWLMGGQKIPAGLSPADPSEALYNDVWVSSDGTNWAQVTASAPWAARGAIQGTAVLGGKLWLIGGGTYNTTLYPTRNYYSDVWSTPDGTNWTQVATTNTWAAREYHNAFAFNNRLWIARGWNGANLGDVWSSSDGATWSQHFSPMIDIHAATVVTNNTGMVMFGGAGGAMTSNTVWLLSVVTNNQPGLSVSNGTTLLNTNVLVDNDRTLFRNGYANTIRVETNTVTLAAGASPALVVSNTGGFAAIIGASKSSFSGTKFYNLRTDAEAAVVLSEDAGASTSPVYLGRFGSTHATRPLDAEIVTTGAGSDFSLLPTANIGLGVTAPTAAVQVTNTGRQTVAFQIDTSLGSASWRVLSNGVVAIPTNYTAQHFVPVAGYATFPISNGAQFKVTQVSTNLISAE